ncbi:MAG: glycosyltransferase, partial [Flavitalea sp.]
SIIMTHQLNVLTGFGKIANLFVNRFIRKYIREFDECWVPDFEGEHSLTGKLSSGSEIDNHTFFIGPLSRFEPCTSENNVSEDKLLVILSGPEPQRTILELKLLKELATLNSKTVFVRGTITGPDISVTTPSGIQIIDLASAEQLNKLICDAGIVISRTGYTSVMDLIKMRKKLIMIPTPGQAEQEYLGEYLAAKRFAVVLDQDKIELSVAIGKARQLVPPKLPPMDLYKKYCNAAHLLREQFRKR